MNILSISPLFASLKFGIKAMEFGIKAMDLGRD